MTGGDGNWGLRLAGTVTMMTRPTPLIGFRVAKHMTANHCKAKKKKRMKKVQSQFAKTSEELMNKLNYVYMTTSGNRPALSSAEITCPL